MIEDWNIEGIAKEVLDEMREEEASIDEVDYFVREIAYKSVYSRMPEDAEGVAALVREKVVAMLEDES